MVRFLWICIAGGIGTGGRYLISLLLPPSSAGFSWAVLTVNLIGSFLLAALSEAGPDLLAPATRLAVTVGLLGGFTTYSAFNQETLEALRSGAWGRAALYPGVTLVGCLGSGAAGLYCGRALAG